MAIKRILAVLTATMFLGFTAQAADETPSAIEARASVKEVCDYAENLREEASSKKTSPEEAKKKRAQATEMIRVLGHKCPGQGSGTSNGASKPTAWVQAEHDLAEARKVLASREAEKKTASELITATGDKLVECGTMSRIVFVGNDGRMFATCKGAADEIFRAPAPATAPAPQVIVVQPANVHQLGGQAPATTPTTPVVVTTPPPSALVLPNGEPAPQGSGNIHYRNPVTGQTVSGTVSSPEEARKWVEQQVAECTRQLRAKPGANPDASCNNTRRVN